MIIAHLGVGLLIIGITGSSVWQEEKITRMKVNDEKMISNYNVVFKEINEIIKSSNGADMIEVKKGRYRRV